VLESAPMAQQRPPSTAQAGSAPSVQPYVPASQSVAEFTLKAVLLGAVFGLIFGASTVYLGLRAGLTVGASIPIAVLAISVLKKLGGSTILENNIVQTIGSAGESVAAGVVFTIPALIFLTPDGPRYFNYLQITILAFAGGILGVLIREVYVPSVTAWVLGNLKVAVGFAFTGAVVGEFVAASRGLGYLLSFAQSTYNAALMMALILMIMVVVLVIFAVANRLETRLLRWN